MLKVLHTKEHIKNLFKKLNSWATGTVKCGCSLLQQFLENTELYFSFGMLSLSCKMFSEKNKHNTFKWEGCNA